MATVLHAAGWVGVCQPGPGVMQLALNLQSNRPGGVGAAGWVAQRQACNQARSKCREDARKTREQIGCDLVSVSSTQGFLNQGFLNRIPQKEIKLVQWAERGWLLPSRDMEQSRAQSAGPIAATRHSSSFQVSGARSEGNRECSPCSDLTFAPTRTEKTVAADIHGHGVDRGSNTPSMRCAVPAVETASRSFRLPTTVRSDSAEARPSPAV